MDAPNVLSITRGSSVVLQLAVTDPEGTPFDLTGAVVWFTAKRMVQDTNPIIQKRSTFADQVVITDMRQGKVEIYLRPADTFDLCVGKVIFDVWVVRGADRWMVVRPTELRLLPSVTRIEV